MPTFRRYQAGEPASAGDLNIRAEVLRALMQMKVQPPLELITGSQGFTLRLNSFFEELVLGTITNDLGTAARDQASSLYQFKTNDGTFTVTTGQRPLLKQYNDTPRVIPAPVNSDCWIWLKTPATPGSTAKVPTLLLCKEQLNFQQCGPSGQFLFNPGDAAFHVDDVLVGKSGAAMVGNSGNLFTAPTFLASVYPEDEAITGKSGEPLVGVSGTLLVRYNPTPVVSPDFFDLWAVGASAYKLLTGVSGDVLETTGLPASVATGSDMVSQSQLTAAVAAAVASSGVPRGTIVMWSGKLAAIPTGYGLCDGTNGTPDLRDKFIKGWAAGVDPGGTGGTLTHTHAAHGNHTHNVTSNVSGTFTATGTISWPGGVPIFAGTSFTMVAGGSGGVTSFCTTTKPAGTISWPGGVPAFNGTAGQSVTMVNNLVASTVENTALNHDSPNHEPPYFKLAFIMKL